MKPYDGYVFLERNAEGEFFVKDFSLRKSDNKKIKIGDKVGMVRNELIHKEGDIYIFKIDSIYATYDDDNKDGELLTE